VREIRFSIPSPEQIPASLDRVASRHPHIRAQLNNGWSCCELGHSTAEAALACLCRQLPANQLSTFRESDLGLEAAGHERGSKADQVVANPPPSGARAWHRRRSHGLPLPQRTEEQERYSRPERSPYYGWCGSCGGWYRRGDTTRWHFLSNGKAMREHAPCPPSTPSIEQYQSRSQAPEPSALELGA
jgi:hypothetical protein